MPVVDAVKAVAAQLIVLHHLAFYGPLSDAADTLAPATISWLSQHARLAVQMFLVVGGFLAARGLSPGGTPSIANPLSLIGRRYWRLVGPYLVALILAMGGSAIARAWLQHDSIPDLPTLPQIVAHILLLQSILGYDALSAGAWYVAIDFQLFAATVLVLWLAQRLGQRAGMTGQFAVVTFALLALISLLYFNLDAEWDVWAVYFIGAYGLGMLAYWSTAKDRSGVWLFLLLVTGLAVMMFNTRPHTIVALGTAIALGMAHRTGGSYRLPSVPSIHFLGRISYSVFLVHFPVCLVVNALFHQVAPGDPLVGATGMLFAWAASVAAGALFHAYVERPLGRLWAPDRRGLPVLNRG